ncbi:MAG: DUF4381 domain-containing protein [Gammaproteobacteria bacterium]
MPAIDLPLRDIHEPAAIGWWPPAIGWWILVIGVPLLIGLALWLYKHLNRTTVIKTAQKKLTSISRDQTLDDLQKLRELSILIRRVAISLAPRKESAGLIGRDWRRYLDQSVKGSPFSSGAGRFLSDAPYGKELPPGVDVNQLINVCEDWLKAQSKK